MQFGAASIVDFAADGQTSFFGKRARTTEIFLVVMRPATANCHCSKKRLYSSKNSGRPSSQRKGMARAAAGKGLMAEPIAAG